MDTQQAYNLWASQYDNNQNKTRDLEGEALKQTLSSFYFENVLEIGCGTGKNTEWLITKAKHVTAVDLSEEMLARAKAKVNSEQVEFIQADINQTWMFANQTYDLATCSLVLEHIENLEAVFQKVFAVLKPNGYCYVGELHPFKQYLGTKARFDTEAGRQIVDCYTHNISDFVKSAEAAGLVLAKLDEHFDDNGQAAIPRILTMVFTKR
jgi:ubiquinone/menaquinone biosynthesis C-methylase UbiE